MHYETTDGLPERRAVRARDVLSDIVDGNVIAVDDRKCAIRFVSSKFRSRFGIHAVERIDQANTKTSSAQECNN